MSRYLLSDSEKDCVKVLKSEMDSVQGTPSLKPNLDTMNIHISESEELLRSLGYGDKLESLEVVKTPETQKVLTIRSFEDLLHEANQKCPDPVDLEDIFSKEELAENEKAIRQLNEKFNEIYHLDTIDITISAIAGILSGAVDCAFGGFVKDAAGRNVPGSMSNLVRKGFDKVLTPERIKKLEEMAKVSYDAMNYDNKGNVIVQEIVDGLSPYFHHEVSVGHDPLLGFILGVLDVLRGTVTTIGFDGKVVVQAAAGYSDRQAQNLFQAIATVFLHMLSDVSGSSGAKGGGMGLPVPFMALFNHLQFGKVGENETIAELVKSMFYQGYDFRHFCAMSIPVMIAEVIVRVSYFAKRLHEGYSFANAIPFGTKHMKKPKLGTMLFIAHTASTAINVGKVAFTKDPLDINYAQWLAFAKYSVKQVKWVLVQKPILRDQYVMGIIDDEWDGVQKEMDTLWNDYSAEAIVVYVF